MQRETSLPGCTFGQKDFTQVLQVQISPDTGARSILGSLLRMKSQPTNEPQKT